jgi:hypothetical protein
MESHRHSLMTPAIRRTKSHTRHGFRSRLVMHAGHSQNGPESLAVALHSRTSAQPPPLLIR